MALPSQPVTLDVAQLDELNRKLSEMRHDINNTLSLIMAAVEGRQRPHPLPQRQRHRLIPKAERHTRCPRLTPHRADPSRRSSDQPTRRAAFDQAHYGLIVGGRGAAFNIVIEEASHAGERTRAAHRASGNGAAPSSFETLRINASSR
jgi:hypothetical protein